MNTTAPIQPAAVSSGISKPSSEFVRPLHPGMGQAVAERTVLRKEDGVWESWDDVAHRVSLGNALLAPGDMMDRLKEHASLYRHIARGAILMSGRHLQHGDASQPTRNMEVFVNCATAPATFLLFYNLLNGAGVGRCYDNDMMLVNWDHAPSLRVVLDHTHPDFDYSAHESVRDAKHKYGTGRDLLWFEVPDSREGWAKALETWEVAAFEKIHKDKLLILDFSKVREAGRPIKGMQNRPSSGPVPLMNAFQKAASIRGAGLDPWLQTMYIDHYFAECVLVGGARRAARMSTKKWDDKGVLEFIRVKRPVEYAGRTVEEVAAWRQTNSAAGKPTPSSFLWSSNNSIAVTEEFWRLAALEHGEEGYDSPPAAQARRVYQAAIEAGYGDGTGEPGFINVDRLTQNDEGWRGLERGDFVGSKIYQVEGETETYLGRLAKRAKQKPFHTITNPCGEIALNIMGGYCVIADVVPFHSDSLEAAEDSFRATARALIRVNTMDSIYSREVRRTNRIGIGMTGIHEFAWRFFQVGFRDLINPNFPAYAAWVLDDAEVTHTPGVRAAHFWHTLLRFRTAAADEAKSYSKKLSLPMPHTAFTVKPAGTTSKLFGLTEGAHLPALQYMLRWVQFRNDDPLVEDYRAKGYPTRKLVKYEGTTIVGFPTAPAISALGMGDALVLAGEATPDEQYRWLKLLEQFWIDGMSGDGLGNQVSYTLKYDPKRVDFDSLAKTVLHRQSQIKACSVMPQEDAVSYEYQPEQFLAKAEYEAICAAIKETMAEDIGFEHVDCGTGGCPVDWDEGAK
jgi:adenosylcobalamin-dependent ribonucleoside-triphosphate reductase